MQDRSGRHADASGRSSQPHLTEGSVALSLEGYPELAGVRPFSRSEIQAQLEAYLNDLQGEVTAVKELIDLMKRKDGE